MGGLNRRGPGAWDWKSPGVLERAGVFWTSRDESVFCDPACEGAGVLCSGGGTWVVEALVGCGVFVGIGTPVWYLLRVVDWANPEVGDWKNPEAMDGPEG